MSDLQITWLAAEAALCLWEAVNEDEAGPWQAWRGQNGTCATRQAIMQMGQACSDDWHALNPPENGELAGIDVFDWEFCPLWLRVAVDWEVPVGSFPVTKQPGERQAAIRAAAPAQGLEAVR